jgi:hypothetical protein
MNLYQQVLFDRDALAHRDSEIQRLQLQILDVSTDFCEMRIIAYEQHLALFAWGCTERMGDFDYISRCVQGRGRVTPLP